MILEDMYKSPIVNEALSEIGTDMTFEGMSGYNGEGNEIQVPGGIVNSMISLFLTEKIGIGVTKEGEIYVEIKGDERDTIIAILYSPLTQKVQACKFEVNDLNTKQALINSETRGVPSQVSVPYIVYQRIVDKYKELEEAWSEILDKRTGGFLPKIANCDGTQMLIDSFVSGAKDNYNFSMGDIENLAVAPTEVYDYTKELLKDKDGTFRLTTAVEKPEDEDPFSTGDKRSYQKIMQDLKAEIFPLVKEYYENLSEEDKALVPDEEKLGIYIPTKRFLNVVKILKDGIINGEKDTQNVLLKGPPGTGKSTMAVAIAYVFSMPYRFTQSYKTADASEYIGTTVADNGVLKTNIETQFAQTVLRGGVHMDDDNNYAAEGEGTVKNSILIAPYTIKLADGTMAKRHPFSIFMMSANPDAKGSRPLNEAYKDRFCAIIDLEKLSENEMVRMVKERSHFEDENVITRMVETWESINENIAESGESADMLSPRSLVNWAKQTRILGDPIEAADYNILGALCTSEEYKQNVMDNIIRPRLGNGRSA